ncbi:hypothetical protein E2320_011765, partial [Naja naja]
MKHPRKVPLPLSHVTTRDFPRNLFFIHLLLKYERTRGCAATCPKLQTRDIIQMQPIAQRVAKFLEFCSHPSWSILENLCLWPLPPDGPSSPSTLLSLMPQRLSLFSCS